MKLAPIEYKGHIIKQVKEPYTPRPGYFAYSTSVQKIAVTYNNNVRGVHTVYRLVAIHKTREESLKQIKKIIDEYKDVKVNIGETWNTERPPIMYYDKKGDSMNTKENDLRILTALYNGNHLESRELERAFKLIYLLEEEAKSRML